MLENDKFTSNFVSSSSARFSKLFHQIHQKLSDFDDTKIIVSKMDSNDDNSRSSMSWDPECPYKPTQWRSTVSAPSCAVCTKPVFPAEEVIAAGQKFHKFCVKCASCNALLNPGNVNEHEKKIYCIVCHRRQFGPQGIGRGLALTVSPSLETPPISPNSTLSNSKLSHQTSDDELVQSKRLSNGEINLSRRSSAEESIPPGSSMNSVTYLGGVTTRTIVNQPPSNFVSNASGFKLTTRTNQCPRCSKTVYSAEEVRAAGKSFHRSCYTCANCNKNINAGRYSEHEGELYDNICYQRLFGPKGVGYGVGSGTLSTGT